jgi:large subunit ribosomal protein L24
LQTTLLGLAIAIILALVAALAGPLLIDWNSYRSIFEAEASHLIGVDMRVTGVIEARLLPSPRLLLRDIAIGKGNDQVRARALAIEFALAPLMRGQWHAAELHLTGATLRLGLDASGRLQAPNIPVNFSPDALSIDQLGIEDARVTLTNAANGGSIVLDKLWFNGEARSLLGPFKGEGAANVGGELYPFRLATGRAADDGAMKVHLNIDPVGHPLSVEADGTLMIPNGEPSFDGTLSLARPAGIASQRASATQAISLPWRLSGKIRATAASALMPQLEFQYGSEEQSYKLTGTADLRFGKRPRFDGVLSGRQIDLDRAATDDTKRSPPVAVARALAALAATAVRPPFPVSIGIGIDRVTLGGNAVENLRGDLSSNARGWSLDRFAFRAPGFTNVRLSGELAADGAGVAFSGPADIDVGDPKALAAWVEGRVAPGQGELRPLRLRGDMRVSNEKLAIEGLTAEFERKPLSGRLLYAFAAGTRAARLEAELAAPELDIDAAMAFGKALLAGSNLQRPQDMAIKADIGRASFGGIDARNASVQVKVDDGGLQIDRLSAADVGGNSLSARGRIDTGAHGPHGSLALDLDLKQVAPVAAISARFLPAGAAAAALDRIGQAKLHATLDVADEKDAGVRLALAGNVDTARLDANARLRGDWARRSVADVQLEGTLDAPEGAALFKLIGLDRIATAGKGPGRLTLQLAGAVADRLGGTLNLSATGVAFSSRVAYAGSAVSFDDINAKLGTSSIRGHATVGTASPRKVDGVLDVDTLDAEDLAAFLVGTPAYASGWSSAAFAGGIIGDLAGDLALKAQRAALTPNLALRGFKTSLHFGKDAVSLDGMAGELAGGRFSGQLSLRSTDNGLAARGKFAMTGADAASLIGAARPPVGGSLDIAADVEGAGFSAAALIGSLRGTGTIALSKGHLAGLDPRAFAAVERAVDDGMVPDATHVSGVVGKALVSGRFPVARGQGDLAISAGQAWLSDVRLQDDNAALAVGGNFDLTDGTLDARLVLSGAAQAGATRPDIFIALNGPIAAPARTIDASALSSWLTLRTIENQSRRLKALESTAQSAPPPALKKEEAPALPAPLVIKPLQAPRRAPQGSLGPQH